MQKFTWVELCRMGAVFGMRVTPIRHVERGGAPISSSRIRRLVRVGQLARAAALLGRPPALYGHVVRGAGRGRRLGFPTANLQLMPHVLPPQGVYAVTLRARDRGSLAALARLAKHGRSATHVRQPGSSTEIAGVMNLGTRPTFGPGPMVCEVHLPGFSGTLLGAPVAVSLLARLRDERCFPTWQALRRQIDHDILRAEMSLQKYHAATVLREKRLTRRSPSS